MSCEDGRWEPPAGYPEEELPGAPDGHYVVLKYSTRFERKRHGTETVVAELDEDDEWRVAGYFVK